MRSLLAVGTFLTLSLGLVMSAEYPAVIGKVDGDKVTFTKKSFKKADKDAKGEEKTLPATNAKVVKATFNKDAKKFEAGDALEGGLKNEAIKAGAFVIIVTDADDKAITEIRVAGTRKKKE